MLQQPFSALTTLADTSSLDTGAAIAAGTSPTGADVTPDTDMAIAADTSSTIAAVVPDTPSMSTAVIQDTSSTGTADTGTATTMITADTGATGDAIATGTSSTATAVSLQPAGHDGKSRSGKKVSAGDQPVKEFGDKPTARYVIAYSVSCLIQLPLRNIAIGEWRLDNPNGTKREFDQYWKALSKTEKKVSSSRNKEFV
jgi:hypothetical protein